MAMAEWVLSRLGKGNYFMPLTMLAPNHGREEDKTGPRSPPAGAVMDKECQPKPWLRRLDIYKKPFSLSIRGMEIANSPREKLPWPTAPASAYAKTPLPLTPPARFPMQFKGQCRAEKHVRPVMGRLWTSQRVFWLLPGQHQHRHRERPAPDMDAAAVPAIIPRDETASLQPGQSVHKMLRLTTDAQTEVGSATSVMTPRTAWLVSNSPVGHEPECRIDQPMGPGHDDKLPLYLQDGHMTQHKLHWQQTADDEAPVSPCSAGSSVYSLEGKLAVSPATNGDADESASRESMSASSVPPLSIQKTTTSKPTNGATYAAHSPAHHDQLDWQARADKDLDKNSNRTRHRPSCSQRPDQSHVRLAASADVDATSSN